jgi:two-component system cell cycle response regulator
MGKAISVPEPAVENHAETLLVIEDDPSIRDLIVLTLKRLDCQIVTAANGMEALARFKEHRPRMIITDVLLPRMNGLDLVRQLNDTGSLDDTAVLMITALGYREIVEKAIQAGVKEFLVKPFDIDDLFTRAQRIWDSLPPRSTLDQPTS